MQWDTGLLGRFKAIGVVPGSTIQVSPIESRGGTVEVRGAGAPVRIHLAVAHAVLVHAVSRPGRCGP